VTGKLSKGEALQISLEIWEEIKDTGCSKDQVQCHDTNYFSCNCPLCEYVDKNFGDIGQNDHCLDHCPIKWSSSEESCTCLCEEEDSPYNSDVYCDDETLNMAIGAGVYKLIKETIKNESETKS